MDVKINGLTSVCIDKHKRKQYTGFIIQQSGSKHVITRKFSRDFIPLIIIL